MRSRMWITVTLALLAPTLSGALLAAQDVPGPLTLADARQVMDAATARARAGNAPGGAIAIVDAGGAVVLLERLDGTFPAASRISIGKARTAAEFRKPTKVLEDAVNGGRVSMTALPDFFPLQGGVPLERRGTVVGAIGVSGAASADQDNEIAMAGAAALDAAGTASASAERSVVWFEAERVREAFARNMPLLEADGFKVNPSRRDGPGEVEVHLGETDIFYVLSGRATLVTGGSVVNGSSAAPGEVRGSAIAGGEAREVKAGDVVVIPGGVPHWFREVASSFTYYTVKVAGGRS